MRIFFDFEFIENGTAHPIIPISIGMVREDGEQYYAEFDNVNWIVASEWVFKNVKPHLRGEEYVKSKDRIAAEIVDFVGENPEFWAYFADYDWVILCQIYGKMIDKPNGWPMFCLDLKQYMWHLGLKKEELKITGEFKEHDALSDAEWNRACFYALLEYRK